jgi:hypothetical protein
MRFLSFDVGTKNLAQCDLDLSDSEAFTVKSWTVETCVDKSVNVNKTALHDLAPMFSNYVQKNIKKWLYSAEGPKPYEHVFIENQPMGGRGSARNLKTKVLSHILQCAILDQRPELKVTFVHPGLKLKDMVRTEGRSTYRENKLYAIAKTAELVVSDKCSNKEDCKTAYLDKKNTKKDDLADAFLQGLIAGSMHMKGLVVVSPEPVKKARKKKTDAKEAIDADAPAAKAEAVAVEAVAAAPEVETTKSGAAKRPRAKK